MEQIMHGMSKGMPQEATQMPQGMSGMPPGMPNLPPEVMQQLVELIKPYINQGQQDQQMKLAQALRG